MRKNCIILIIIFWLVGTLPVSPDFDRKTDHLKRIVSSIVKYHKTEDFSPYPDINNLDYSEGLSLIIRVLDRSSDDSIKESIMWFFLNYYEVSARDSIINQLNSSNEDIKELAIESLGGSENKQNADVIYPLLKDKNPEIRKAVLESLARLADKRVFEGLNDKESSVKDSVVYNIAISGNVDLVKILIGRYEKNNSGDNDFFKYLRCLGIPEEDKKFQDFLINKLASNDDSLVAALIIPIHRLNLGNENSIFGKLIFHRSKNVREIVLSRLSKSAESKTLEMLKEELKSSNVATVLIALKSLSFWEGESIIDPVISLLTHESELIRIYTMKFLNSYTNFLKYSDVPPPPPGGGDFFDKYEIEKDFNRKVANRLKILSNSRMIAQNIKDLNSDNTELSNVTVEFLKHTRPKEVFLHLLNMLKKNRFNVIGTLRKYGDKRAVPGLMKVLNLPDKRIVQYFNRKTEVSKKEIERFRGILVNSVLQALCKIGDDQLNIPFDKILNIKYEYFDNGIMEAINKFRPPDGYKYLLKKMRFRSYGSRKDYLLFKLYPEQYFKVQKEFHLYLSHLIDDVVRKNDSKSAKLLYPHVKSAWDKMMLANLMNSDEFDMKELNTIIEKQIDEAGAYINYDVIDDLINYLDRIDPVDKARMLVKILKIYRFSNLPEVFMKKIILDPNTTEMLLKELQTILLKLISEKNCRVNNLPHLILHVLKEKKEGWVSNPLHELLISDDELLVADVLSALGKIQEMDSIPHIKKFLADPRFFVRMSAFKALKEFADSHEDSIIRKTAGSILNKVFGNDLKSDKRKKSGNKSLRQALPNLIILSENGLNKTEFFMQENTFKTIKNKKLNGIKKLYLSGNQILGITDETIYKFSNDLEMELELQIGKIGSVTAKGNLIILATRGQLATMNQDLKPLDLTDLKINIGSRTRKNAHDMLIFEDTALLLDNIYEPIYIITADISDPENVSLKDTVEVGGVNAHLALHAFDPIRKEWHITKESQTMGGFSQSLGVVSINNCLPKREYKTVGIWSIFYYREKNDLRIKAMVSGSPPWYVYTRDGRYHVANIDTRYNKLKFINKLDLRIDNKDEIRNKDLVIIRNNKEKLYITINNHLIIVSTGKKMKIIHTQNFKQPVKDFVIMKN